MAPLEMAVVKRVCQVADEAFVVVWAVSEQLEKGKREVSFSNEAAQQVQALAVSIRELDKISEGLTVKKEK